MLRRVWGFTAFATALTLHLALLGPTAEAAPWADRLFGETSHDFGPVPRGAKVRHTFTLVNRLNEPVNLVDVHASCGCTTGRVSTPLVKPGETASVEAEMDTRNFVGKKSTVLYVNVVTTSGKSAEVRLNVSSTILSDIVLNPGTIDFGAVGRGQAPMLTATIDRIGLSNWRVERMVTACRVVDATLTEVVRNKQKVGYQLKVSLKPDAPAGVVRDEIRLITNDKESPVFPIQLTATIRGDLTASPSVLSLGKATASATGVQGKFLVRSSKPFVVRSVEGEGDGFVVAIDDPGAKPIHVLTLTFKPEESKERGDLRRVFKVHTDLVGEPPLELQANVRVEP